MAYDTTDFIVTDAPAPACKRTGVGKNLNIENLQKVRDHIAKLPGQNFNMDYWARNLSDLSVHPMYECDTVSCIGGWTNFLFGGERYSERLAAIHLGMTSRQAHELFYPPNGYFDDGDDYCTITTAEACMVLDHLKATGRVNWGLVHKARKAAR